MEITGKRIFITGGAGFIGTKLAARLVKDNQIVIYDNLHRNAIAGTRLIGHPNVQFIKGDVLDAEGVAEAMAGSNLVIHLASIAGVNTVLEMPVTTMKVCLIGTYNVLEAALKEQGIERFIDFSTSEVFGTYAYKVREGDVTTLGAVGEARWTYAVSKLATEHLAHNYYKQYGLPALSIRPFNIYGPGQVGRGAVHIFVVRALQNEDLEIHNDGNQIRAWCYIDDIVDGILLCLEKPEAVGQAINIGNARSVRTIYDLARQIVQLSESQSRIIFTDWNYVDVELRIPDINKAKQLLGYEPKVDLEDGLLRTIEWYRRKIAA
jgi:nucleoside-diphosphate-sugar epimerase